MVRSIARLSAVTLCLLALAAPLSAKDKANKVPRVKKAGVKAPRGAHAFRIPKSISLSAEQQAKLEEIRKQYEPKIEEAQHKQSAVLSEEQKTLKLEAERDAKQRIVQIKAEVAAKAKITPEQEKQLKDSSAEVAKLNKEARTQVMALLTEEQKAVMHTKAPKGAKRQKKAS